MVEERQRGGGRSNDSAAPRGGLGEILRDGSGVCGRARSGTGRRLFHGSLRTPRFPKNPDNRISRRRGEFVSGARSKMICPVVAATPPAGITTGRGAEMIRSGHPGAMRRSDVRLIGGFLSGGSGTLGDSLETGSPQAPKISPSGSPNRRGGIAHGGVMRSGRLGFATANEPDALRRPRMRRTCDPSMFRERAGAPAPPTGRWPPRRPAMEARPFWIIRRA